MQKAHNLNFQEYKLIGMLSCISREEFMEFTLRIMETSMMLMRQNTLATGSPVYQHVFIFDMGGFSLRVNNLAFLRMFSNSQFIQFKRMLTIHKIIPFALQTATYSPTLDILKKLIAMYEGSSFKYVIISAIIY